MLSVLTARWPGSAAKRAMGVRQVLDWLETLPGDTWQQRWQASGAEQAGHDWADLVPLGAGSRGGGTAQVSVIRFGVSLLLIGQVIRPSLAWLLDQKHSQTLVRAFAAIDPTGLADLRRVYQTGQRTGGRLPRAVNILARILIHKGGPLSAVTVGDCVHYWRVHRERGTNNAESTLFYTLLFDLGVFGPDAPPTLTAATRRGPMSCAELIDRYEIACTPIRDLLVEYLSVRKPTVDHTSLAGIAAHLALLFWKDLERHHPGIDSLDLPAEVAAGWKQRLGTITHGHAKGRRRAVPENTLMCVRSFYADLAHWAAEDPARWGRFVAPCPIRASEVSFKKRRQHRKAMMDQRTRTLAPVLPTLVRVVTEEHQRARARFEAAQRVGHLAEFTVDGRAYRRWVPAPPSQRVLAIEQDTGARIDLTQEQERTFWAFASVEVLRHTGVRIEEMLELSHYSFCAYTLPSTGEVVPMLQVAPSKTDAERLLLVSPELGEVLAAIINRVRGDRSTIPLVSQWDGFEKQWSPRMPFLFQRSIGGQQKPITRTFVAQELDRAMRLTGLTDASGQALRFCPHDFRRIFATDALRAGLPPHIAAKILGHVDLNTTLGYAAIYPEDVITHHRAFIARRRSLRPSEEYRDLTSAEWDEFLAHFELRKVELGVCTRDFGTPCVHEHACIRCPALRPDPSQRPRLEVILANLHDRKAEAETQGWRGELAGLEVSIAAAEHKLTAMRELAARHQVTHLGMPDFGSVTGRASAGEVSCRPA
ncbi:tyrosine-type recombinase/integrase [Actinokineospora inagensis]|uniref:tyrosine-type recombinase/integrase n=1 Tax=Actinokineospora inagensis TaxID=103730 RepID=UPI00146FA74E|nr:site-specific integrase [Actinokineospora inagensis]